MILAPSRRQPLSGNKKGEAGSRETDPDGFYVVICTRSKKVINNILQRTIYQSLIYLPCEEIDNILSAH